MTLLVFVNKYRISKKYFNLVKPHYSGDNSTHPRKRNIVYYDFELTNKDFVLLLAGLRMSLNGSVPIYKCSKNLFGVIFYNIFIQHKRKHQPALIATFVLSLAITT